MSTPPLIFIQVDSLMDSAIDYTNMFEGRCALIYVIDVLEDYRVMLNTDNNY